VSSLLDSLLAKIASLEAAQTLEAAKAAAVSTVNASYSKYNQSAYTTNYSSLTSAKNTGISNINNATSVSGVITAQDAALTAMAAVKSDAVLLGEAKMVAVNTLSGYIPRGMTSSAYSSAYNATGKTQISDYRTAGIITINAATAISSVNDCLAQYKGYIDDVKTITEINAAALAAAKTSAKADLSAYGSISIYRPAQQSEFTAAKNTGSKNIDDATTINGVNTALAAAKSAIAEIDTDAQLTAAELATAKTNAKIAINGLKVKENYTQTGWALVTAKMSSWCAYVDACTAIDAITNQTTGAVKKATDDINTVPTADEDSVATAKSIVEHGTYTAPQASAGDAGALKTWLVECIKNLTGMNLTGITAASGDITVPWLIVHGRDDETVPASEAERLSSLAGPNAELLILDGVNHSFGGKHPLTEMTPTLESVTRETVSFFAQHLAHREV
jgi:hypothetical protein